jgi:serine/threonine protein kinase
MTNLFSDLPEDQMLRVDRLCSEFETALRNGRTPIIEEFLARLQADDRPTLLRELILLEAEYAARSGRRISPDEYQKRFPDVDPKWFDDVSEANQVQPDNSQPTPPRDPENPDAASRRTKKLRVLGDYRILKQIGRGGMGTVYQAVHERMGRTVALKVLRPEIQRDSHLMERFDREIRTAASLSHPNIVAAYDAREFQGIRFLITEFVDGTDLDAFIRRNSPFDVERAIDIVTQVARGLEYAHERGVIHRDIKPGNLILDRSGVVRILDMGLARLELPDHSHQKDLTGSGMIMGTAAYMAPEQARNTRRADARADIYSLGCTLYFLLNGRPPFVSESAIDAVLAHATQPIPSLRDRRKVVPKELEVLYQRMLAKDPAARVATATEVIETLRQIPVSETTPVAVVGTPRRWAVVTGIVLVVIGAVSLWMMSPSENEPASTTQVDNSAGSDTPGGSATNALTDAASTETPRQNVDVRSSESPRSLTAPEAGSRHAVKFDGRTSYLRVQDLIPEPGASYTLEVIVRPRSFQTSNTISWLGPDWMALYISDQGYWGMARRFGTQSFVNAAVTPATIGQWVHVAGVFESSEMTLYVNGRVQNTQPVPFGLPETRGGLYVGGVNSEQLPPDQNDRFFAGDIDCVRISEGIRYTGAFQPPERLAVDSRTVVALPLNEGSGTFTQTEGQHSVRAILSNAMWIRVEESRLNP